MQSRTIIGKKAIAFLMVRRRGPGMGRATHKWGDYALTTLPLRRQDVHTRMCLVVAPTLA